jgi:hypothetical protein
MWDSEMGRRVAIRNRRHCGGRHDCWFDREQQQQQAFYIRAYIKIFYNLYFNYK